MPNRRFRASDVAKHLKISWYMVDKLTRTQVLPCDRIVVGKKVARMYNLDECKKYHSLLQHLFDMGVPRTTAYLGVVNAQKKDGVHISEPASGKAPLLHFPVDSSNFVANFVAKVRPLTPRPVYKDEPESKSVSFIIAFVLFTVIILTLVYVLLLK